MSFTLMDESLTLFQIYQAMGKIRDPNAYVLYPIHSFETSPIVGVKSILYQARVVGSEGKPYDVFVQFFDVGFSSERKPGYTPVKSNGGVLYYEVPSTANNRVALKCVCTDFRFMWEKPLYDNKALVGTYRRYHPPEEPKRIMPPKNPENIPGFCKHLASFIRALINSGMVED